MGGLNWIQLVQPHRVGQQVDARVEQVLRGPAVEREAVHHVHSLDVAVQVEFKSQTLKPVFHFIGSRLETRRFQAMGQLDSTFTAPP
jgi:hypothetical protein